MLPILSRLKTTFAKMLHGVGKVADESALATELAKAVIVDCPPVFPVAILQTSREGAVICLGIPLIQPKDDHTHLIAAGPLVKQDNVTMAYRIVLRYDGRKFIIHNQMFPNFREESHDLSGSHYHEGSYLGYLDEAMEALAHRMERFANNCGNLRQVVYKEPVATA